MVLMLAGLVQSWAAIVMGILSGSIPWVSMMILHKKSALLQKVFLLLLLDMHESLKN
jgi:ammonia channel protein AmtB